MSDLPQWTTVLELAQAANSQRELYQLLAGGALALIAAGYCALVNHKRNGHALFPLVDPQGKNKKVLPPK